MSNFTLVAAKRRLTDKPKILRQRHYITAELYGTQKENLHLCLAYQAFRKIFKKAGESTIINLVVGGSESEPVLIHQVDYDPCTNNFQHVDLRRVDLSKKISARVAIRLTGVAPAVKNLGGILTQAKSEVEVKCLPADLVKEIKLDVQGLTELNSALHIADLPLERSKFELSERAETLVCRVEAPKTSAQLEQDLAEQPGESVGKDLKEESEKEKAAAEARKGSDKEKKGPVK